MLDWKKGIWLYRNEKFLASICSRAKNILAYCIVRISPNGVCRDTAMVSVDVGRRDATSRFPVVIPERGRESRRASLPHSLLRNALRLCSRARSQPRRRTGTEREREQERKREAEGKGDAQQPPSVYACK